MVVPASKGFFYQAYGRRGGIRTTRLFCRILILIRTIDPYAAMHSEQIMMLQALSLFLCLFSAGAEPNPPATHHIFNESLQVYSNLPLASAAYVKHDFGPSWPVLVELFDAAKCFPTLCYA